VSFPVYLHVGAWTLHPHAVFEVLAYLIGVLLLLSQRRHRGDPIDRDARFSIVAFAILGGAIGARLLYWLEDPAATQARWYDITYLFGGKTVVGGLLGGLIAVEIVKRRLGIVRRTGDIFAVLPALASRSAASDA
jgi:prolipoprotein diacylglyceryltransferase